MIIEVSFNETGISDSIVWVKSLKSTLNIDKDVEKFENM